MDSCYGISHERHCYFEHFSHDCLSAFLLSIKNTVRYIAEQNITVGKIPNHQSFFSPYPTGDYYYTQKTFHHLDFLVSTKVN